MNSEEMNRRISELDDGLEPSYGKPVPYIGWFWRQVDFDADGYNFGIIGGEFTGFMENNKWDYNYTRRTTPDEWANIKRLIAELLEEPAEDKVKAVWKAIQAVR